MTKNTEPQLGDQVTVNGHVGEITKLRIADDTYLVEFGDWSEWIPVAKIEVVGTREVSVIELIAGALTQYERDFSLRAGQGLVNPGDFSSDHARATDVLATLDRAGYQVVRKS